MPSESCVCRALKPNSFSSSFRWILHARSELTGVDSKSTESAKQGGRAAHNHVPQVDVSRLLVHKA